MPVPTDDLTHTLRQRCRVMRAILFFDLPTETAADRKNYRLFRKFLIKEGFIMMQKSVYSKLVLNETAYRIEVDRIRGNRPPEGIVQMMHVTEKQYSDMAFIVGDALDHDQIDTLETLVVI